MRPRLDVLFDDAHLIAIAKPSGMIAHRGWAQDDDDALRSVRDQVGARVHVLHRLDRGTSGVLLFARDSATASRMTQAFTDGAVEKTYFALVRGHDFVSRQLDHPVRRGEDGERVPALTEFRHIADSTGDRCGLVRARPRTGRTHQIRRHLKHLAHPIIGDVRYGDGSVNRHYRATWGVHRLALHALDLEFSHPWTAERIRITCPLSGDFLDPLRALGLATAATASLELSYEAAEQHT